MLQKQSTAQKSEASQTESRRRTAAYIADLTAEMERLARQEGLDSLSDVLRSARLEAQQIAVSD